MLRTAAGVGLTLLGVSLVVFVLMRVVPGDPVAMMIPPGASPADVQRLYAFYGLDRPIAAQYGLWLSAALRGEFGTSISLKQDVLGLVLARLPATLELGAGAMALALWLGGAAGVLSASAHGRWPATLVDGAAALVQAVPDFLWGLVFILLFGVWWTWLPISGRIDPMLAFDAHSGFLFAESLLRGRWDVTASVLSHALAPALALGLPVAAMVARVLKASMQEALAADYVLLARLKGLSPLRVLLAEALPNALTPTLQLSGVQFAFLLGGTVLVERLFSYPGIGSLAIQAVVARDLPLIQAIVLTFAVLFITINLLVDALTRWLNPRLRAAGR